VYPPGDFFFVMEMGMTDLTRREILTGAALVPLGAAVARAQERVPVPPGDAPPPRYTLSCNIELMFPAAMPHADRIRRIADAGLKAYSFWGTANKDTAAMRRVQQQTGLACGSISGNPRTGWSTGLTRTGEEASFLKEFEDHAIIAKDFGVKNLICFVGETQPGIALDVQHRQIVSGLRKAGDIAAKHDVYFCLEPLNIVEYPKMHVLTATHGFKIIEDVNHPHVLLDYDMHQIQYGEGNIINSLRRGLRNTWIRFVEIGDVPGRLEPGTGEMNHENLFKVLRIEGFADYVGMEHGTSSTPEHAMAVVRRVAGV
jgi:hydroxypyruvate isomerase